MRECGNEILTEISYLVLLAFCSPNHGYGVMQFLEEHTEGRVKPGAGTLYGAVNALLKKEWIALYARLKLNYTLGQQILNGGDENGSD